MVNQMLVHEAFQSSTAVFSPAIRAFRDARTPYTFTDSTTLRYRRPKSNKSLQVRGSQFAKSAKRVVRPSERVKIQITSKVCNESERTHTHDVSSPCKLDKQSVE